MSLFCFRSEAKNGEKTVVFAINIQPFRNGSVLLLITQYNSTIREV